MVQVDVTYTGDLQCRCVHGPSGQVLLTDAPVDNNGKGENFSPTDLIGTALSTCMFTIMGTLPSGKGSIWLVLHARCARKCPRSCRDGLPS